MARTNACGYLKKQEDLAAWRDLMWRQVHEALFQEIPRMFFEDHRTEFNDAQTYTAHVEYASELLLVTRQEYTRLKIKALGAKIGQQQKNEAGGQVKI